MTEFVWRGDEIERAVVVQTGKALFAAGEHLKAESNLITPISSGGGKLRESAFVDVDKVNLEATVSYNTVYAVRQHEGVGFNYTNPNAKRKYLEVALNAEAGNIQKFLADGVRRALKE